MIINRPVVFTGTKEQRDLNYATHNFVTHLFSGDHGEYPCDQLCVDCDCRPSHIAADYPCGVEVPRETVEVSF